MQDKNRNFQIKKLNDIAKISAGQTAPKNNFFTEEGIPFVRAGSLEFLERGESIDLCEKISEENAKTCKLKLYPANSILFAKSGMSANKGRIYKLKQSAYVVSHLAIVTPNETKLISEYLMYWLQKHPPKTLIKDESYPSISLTDIANMKIELPSLEEQKKIARILDKADEIRTKKRLANAKLDEFLKSTFISMFGDVKTNIKQYPVKNLGECIEFNPQKPMLKDDDIVTFLGMKDITENGQICGGEDKEYNEVKSGFTNFKNNDVLLAKITPCFENGKATIARNLTNNAGFGSTEFHVLRPLNGIILPEYLYQIIHSAKFIKSGSAKMSGAVGQKRVPKLFILSYKIVLPPIEEQNKFAQIVEKVEKQKQKNEQVIEQMDNLFNSLSQQAFKGGL